MALRAVRHSTRVRPHDVPDQDIIFGMQHILDQSASGERIGTKYKLPQKVKTYTGDERLCTAFVDYTTRNVEYICTRRRPSASLQMSRNYMGLAAALGVTVRAFRTDVAREWLVKEVEKNYHAKEIDALWSPPHEE